MEILMNSILKGLSVITLSLGTAVTFAAPAFLTTHNNTNEESNAYVAGTIPSPYPTAPHSDNQVFWNMVKIACYGHTSNNKCSAAIKMATNTANPIVLGTVIMDLETGDISPKRISENGYTFIVNGPGEVTINKN
jgi:hypothetical protein